jgi:uncharacterized damage-inducible protein DinB
LLETCLTLSQDQRDGRPRHVRFDPRDGWHLVGSDAWYLFVLNGDRSLLIDEDQANLYELSAAMERTGLAWSALLAGNPDSAAVVTEVDEDDGFQKRAPIGIRLAQVLPHGTDHSSQICTALTSLGVKPLNIDAWDYGLDDGAASSRSHHMPERAARKAYDSGSPFASMKKT